MAWSKSLQPKFTRLEEKKKESSFYDDYKANVEANKQAEGNKYTAGLMKKSSSSGTKKSSSTSSGSSSNGSSGKSGGWSENVENTYGYNPVDRVRKNANNEQKSQYTFTPKYGSAVSSFNVRPQNLLNPSTRKRFTPSTIMGRLSGTERQNIFTPRRAQEEKRNIFVPNTYITASKFGNVIPGISDDLAESIKELSKQYKNITSSNVSGIGRNKALHNLYIFNKSIFDRYKQETGGDLTMQDVVDMADKYTVKEYVPTVVGARENSFDNMPKYQQQKQDFQVSTAKDFKAKYGVDINNFGSKELKALIENNPDVITIDFLKNDDQFGSLNVIAKDKQTEAEYRKLARLAQYNENRTYKPNATEVLVTDFMNTVHNGRDFNNKRWNKTIYSNPDDFRYILALNNENKFLPSQLYNRASKEHPVAAQIGSGAGELTTTLLLGGAYGEAMGSVGALANKPSWVTNAVKSGLTFGTQRGLQSAGKGDSAGRVAREAAIGAIGGAAGGAVSEVTSGALGKFLSNKGMRDKVIPQIARAGLTGASFSLADNASTYYLHPKDERPTLAEMEKNVAVAFAFGSISSAISMGKVKEQSRAALDTFDNAMTKEYDAMLQAAYNGNKAEVTQRAYRVLENAEQIEKLLNGEKVEVYANNREIYPEPIMTIEDSSFVGEANRVKLMKEDLKTIKDRVTDYLSASGENLRTQAKSDSVPEIGSGRNLVEQGLARDAQTGANRYAQRMQDKLDKGKQLSDWNIGRQVQKNEAAIQSEVDFAAAMSKIKPTEIKSELWGKDDNGNIVEINEVSTPEGVKASTNGSQDILTSIKHGWSHQFKMLDPAAYQTYEDSIIKAARETNNKAVDNRINYLMNKHGYSLEKANEEIAAELSSGFNTRAIQRMAEGNRGLVDSVLKAIRTAKSNIRSSFTNGNYKTQTGLEITFRGLNEAEKGYIQGLDKARGNVSENGEVRYSAVGKTVDGKTIYKTNYPANTPKQQKQTDLINIVQNVWSQKPITLQIGNGETITAQFDPNLSTRSDLSKIAFGNRKGTAKEQRITLNLASDLYQIAQESQYQGGKSETGKNNPAHKGVRAWKYFVTDLVYVEEDGTKIPGHVNIDVKQKADGSYFYSFAFEKGIAPQTLLAAVSEEASPTIPSINSISQNEPIVKNSIKENTGNQTATDNIGTFDKNNADIQYSIKEKGDEEGKKLSNKENTGNQPKTDNITAYKTARELVNVYAVKGKINVRELSGRLNGLAATAHDVFFGGNVVEKYPAFEARARSIATDIAKEMRYTTYTAETEEMYKNMREYIKSFRIKITDEIKSDIPDWNEFRKKNMGKIVMSNNGTPIDVLYKDLMERFPGSFDEAVQTTQADQLIHIVNTLDSLKAKEAKLNEADYTQAVDEITDKIIADAINIAGEYKGEVNTPEETEFDRQAQAAYEAAAPWESYAAEWNVPEFTRDEYEGMKDRLTKKQQEKVKQLKEQFKKQREAEKERRLEAEDRNRLLRLAREVNNMRMSPSEMALIPDILKEIDTKSVRILKKGFTTSDGRTVMGELDLKQLRDDYEMISQTDPDFIPDKNIEAKINRLDKMQIGDMDISDVRELIRAVQEVKHEIRTNRALINDAEKREVATTAAKVALEIYQSKGSGYLRKLDRFLDNYNSIQLSAMREFRRLSGYATGSQLVSLAKALNDGQRKSLEFQQRTTRKFEELTSQTDEMKRFTGKKAERIDISKYAPSGQKVYITPDMRVALYLHSKNNYSLRHINYGGITVPEINLLEKGDYKNALARGTTIKLTPSQVKSITDGMTDFEKAFADKAYDFFNKDSKEAVNETSLALKGYELAQVKDYFPIATDKNFTRREFESLIKDGTLEGSGYLKERINAGGPIVLEGVVSVISRQQKNVGAYYGLAIPIRNFNKVYNATGSNYKYSTKQALGKKWGATATNYIENLITDLQEGRKASGNTIFDAALSEFKGNYAQAVLAINPTVIMQQAASYPTAAAVTGFKPLIKGLASKVTEHDKAMIDKYTPLLWYRSKGYSTSELGDYADGTSEDWTKNSKAPKFMGLIQQVDVATVTKLWKAAEFYVQDNYTELEKGSDEYYKQVADVYNKVIEETQPNYTTMQRPDILRSPNKLISAATMFKTQIMQNYNILYDAYGEWDAKRLAYKAKKNDTTKAEYKAAQGKFSRAISSQITAALVLSLMKGVGNYLKGKFKKRYSDDDGELSNKSIFKRYALDVAETIAGTTLGGGEIIEGIETIANKISGNYSREAEVISAPSINAINDFINTLYNFAAVDYGDVLTNPGPFIKALNELAKSAGKIKGVPVENVENILSGFVNNIISQFDDTGRLQQGLIDGNKVRYFKEKLMTQLNDKNANKFIPILKNAKKTVDETTGDKHEKALNTYEEIYDDMLRHGVSEDKIKNALREKAAKQTTFGDYFEKPAVLNDGVPQFKSRQNEKATQAELEDLKDWEGNIGINKKTGKIYFKDDDGNQYELTDEQARYYKNTLNTRTAEYRQSLINGSKNIEDVLEGNNEFSLYADEMTQAQYDTAISKKGQKAETLEKFIDGKSTKKISLRGNYNDYPERVQRNILNRAATMAKQEIQKEMEDTVKANGVFYAPPSHARNSSNTTNTRSDTEVIQSYVSEVSNNIAKAAPDYASRYSAGTLAIGTVEKVTINGTDYSLSSDMSQIVTEAAKQDYSKNIVALENNEINIEDIYGYRKSGKPRESTQRDGTTVALTGKLYNEDGTPRFDALVTGRIYYQLKENSINYIANQYANEIKGGASSKSVQTSKNNSSGTKQSSGKSSSKRTSKSSSGGSSKRSSSSRGSSGSGYVSTARGTTPLQTASNGIFSRSATNLMPTMFVGNPNYISEMNKSISQVFRPSPIKPKKVKTIKPLQFM